MRPEELYDWRIGVAGKVGKPVPPGYTEGEVVYILRSVRVPGQGRLVLPIAAAERLALHIAIRAAHEAVSALGQVRFIVEKKAREKTLDFSTARSLFDYFERCMEAATFSYQAIESYANDLLERRMRGLRMETFQMKRRGKMEDLSAENLQRFLSTEEKVATLLPALMERPIDKSSKLWRDFTVLGRVRDGIVHLKPKEILRSGTSEKSQETLVARLLSNNPRSYPRVALAIIRHFAEYDTADWLDPAETWLRDPASEIPLRPYP